MRASVEMIEAGLLGLLVGDAVGVPYEFHEPECLPPIGQIEMIPPRNFPRSYNHIAPGTWSDDGAQALCLAASLIACDGWSPEDFAARLLRWRSEGYMAVDGRVFDIGIQTAEALNRLAAGLPPSESGLGGERNNGNGSLMRCLPVALLGPEESGELVRVAHEQSRVTHAHPRSEACCALYALWARHEMAGRSGALPAACEELRAIYEKFPAHLGELTGHILPALENTPSGSGYVVDSLCSAVAACAGAAYETIVKKAVAFGHDTDTTACVAGGIAGIRHGRGGIPGRWLEKLRGRAVLEELFSALRRAREGR